MGIENRTVNDIPRIIEETPSQITEGLRRFQQDVKYFDDNWISIVKEHPNQFVAVLNEQLVSSASDYAKLVTSLKKSGIPPEDVLVKFTGEQKLILAKAA